MTVTAEMVNKSNQYYSNVETLAKNLVKAVQEMNAYLLTVENASTTGTSTGTSGSTSGSGGVVAMALAGTGGQDAADSFENVGNKTNQLLNSLSTVIQQTKETTDNIVDNMR